MRLEKPTKNCLLSGLPGSGIKRFAKALSATYPTQVLGWQAWQGVHAEATKRTWLANENSVRLWLLDIRQNPKDLLSREWLAEPLLAGMRIADAVVFVFTEQADLAQQSKWQTFMQQYAADLPIFRSFSEQVPQSLQSLLHTQDFTGRSSSLDLQAVEQLTAAWQPWESIQLEGATVSLETLMMALANSQQSLGMKISRIQAELQTLEYENRVALEVTGFHWQTFAADQQQSGASQLRIEGVALDKEWLQQLLEASQASIGLS